LGTWAAEQYRIPGSPLTTNTDIPEPTDDGKANDCT
jgi:endogenous inhibitor of DNA gyrase (YacG/DUF329 family)